MKKQIVGTTIWQVFILVLVMLLGHLMIPESPDAFDSIIGLDWSMKYSDSTQRFVVNGLNSNLLLDTPSYSNVYNTYGIHSRHLTVVFNIYALMQIFNFLNCRKTKDKMINIIEGIEPQTVLIFFAALTIHFVFMILAG